ncbi:cytochrome P450 [Aspergillus mulundensis]|uniref:Cytochrome P450 n=1 Tax=Aspergillus mulundensis TaxID=1810919 RepID=A0A3D8QAD7_9EURO|nr:Cytochrome P450 [Aspergillus mulundensis]RDW58578.1 Cytochrome P450 [Aspergillus mulundensis]
MILQLDYNATNLALTLCAVGIAYCLSLAVYRLWLSAVSGFPGAFWPKVTFLYEFYYDWVHHGQYYRRIHEMHRQYGPIIRVSPVEIHVEDPLFYHEMFVPANVRKADAYPAFAQGTGFEDVVNMCTTHEGHKAMRDPAVKLYSKVATHEPTVLGCVRAFCDRLKAERNTGRVLNITHACLSLAIDVATSVTFQGESNYLADPTFNEKLLNVRTAGVSYVPLFANLPPPLRCVTLSVSQFLASLSPDMREWDQKARGRIMHKELQEPTTKLQGRTKPWKRPETALRVGQVIQENAIFNLSHTVTTLIAYLALDNQRRRKLQDELAAFWAERPRQVTSFNALRGLPYLEACIKEGLRLGNPALHRIPRVFPDDDMVYKDWVIPKRTPISMTPYYMHMDPTVFPDPDAFNPERWFGPGSEADGIMHKYFVPFGKGSRACVGENIARLQIYFAISQLYKPGAPEIELFGSDESDVRLVRGYIFPLPRLGSKGVRAIVRSPQPSEGGALWGACETRTC